jgi:hypothetical protein
MKVNYHKSPATSLTKWNEPTDIHLEEYRCMEVHLQVLPQVHLKVQLQNTQYFTEKFKVKLN